MNDLLKMAAKELGSRGGKATKKKLGKAHFQRIQKLAAQKRRENKFARENSPVKEYAIVKP